MIPQSTVVRSLIVAATTLLGVTPAMAATCESLVSLSLPQTTITSAQIVAAGAFVPPPGPGPVAQAQAAAFSDVPAFCRVSATLAPSSDSDIKIEVWLPAAGWNGKFLGTGNGAFGGAIGFAALAGGIRRGYAVVATDTGHVGPGASFALGHPEKLTDYVERAVHEMTVKGKAIVEAFYGSGPKLSYWNGCSTGGRQALTEVQRFPEDFDGIVAGAPANYTTRSTFGQVWFAQAVRKDEASAIPPSKFPLIQNAAVEACDAMDGVKDGVLEDPTRCTFDPKVLLCKDRDGEGCLNPAQVEAVAKIYTGAKHSRTGEQLFPGLERGSELGWGSSVNQPVGYATDFFKYIVFKDPSWDFMALNYDSHLALADEAGRTLDAMNLDLSKFLERRGKLLMYAGWSDPGIPPRNIVTYYKAVSEKAGQAARDSVRLFMVPGMGHCGGGNGTSTFDMLSALEAWVEKGQAPSQIPASRVTNGVVDRTRPLCAYPQVATYKGSGNTDEMASFVCK